MGISGVGVFPEGEKECKNAIRTLTLSSAKTGLHFPTEVGQIPTDSLR